jgi:hypothetical protein
MQMQRFGMHTALRLAAGAEGLEFCRANLVQDRFGDDRARRISGADKQDIKRLLAHGCLTCGRPLLLQV